MKLYEAIRLGSMLHPQGFGVGRRYVGGVVTKTCALGAAMEALGNTEYNNLCKDLMSKKSMPCPIHSYNEFEYNICSIVVHLNDHHRWTRPQIADWLEPIEEGLCKEVVEDKELTPMLVEA